MKLLKKNKGYCLVEVEEMIAMTCQRDVEEMISLLDSTGATRKSFNTWLFPTVKLAEEFVFMYKLKYEN